MLAIKVCPGTWLSQGVRAPSVFRSASRRSPGPLSQVAVLLCWAGLSIQVKFTEKKKSFLHFLTNVCAIVGGELSCCHLRCTRPGLYNKACHCECYWSLKLLVAVQQVMAG